MFFVFRQTAVSSLTQLVLVNICDGVKIPSERIGVDVKMDESTQVQASQSCILSQQLE